MMDALHRALGTFRNKKEWTEMMKRGMAQDFSWDKPRRSMCGCTSGSFRIEAELYSYLLRLGIRWLFN